MCKNNELVRLAGKLLLISLPVLLVAIAYLITDPSKKLRQYERYDFDYLMLNRGDISTRVFMKNKDRYPYDSFVFGSSRSCSHDTRSWKDYLPAGSVPFAFGSWNEPIEGVCSKLKLIDRCQMKIRNAFVVIDVDCSFVQPPLNSLLNDHYLISGQGKLEYFLSDFRAYLTNPRLVVTSVDYSLFGKRRAYMKEFVGMKPGEIDPITNDWEYRHPTPITETDYEKVRDKFYQRPPFQHYEKRQIDPDKVTVLKEMAALFRKHNTNVFIIISPLYNQKKLNSDDMAVLQNIFGRQNVYDYSGINCLTNDIHNYKTDVKHYLKSVGDTIFEDVYRVKKGSAENRRVSRSVLHGLN